MNKTYRLAIVGGLMIAAVAAYTLWMFPLLPEIIPTHWGISGKADQFSPKVSGAFLGLWIMIGVYLMMLAIPKLSPKSKSIDEFRDSYDLISLIVVGLVGYIQIIALQGAVGSLRVDFAIVLGILVMFGLMGNWMGKIRPNYYMGIRTPWTLESPSVWEKTHRLAGRVIVGASVIGVLMLLIGVHPMIAVFLVVAATIYPAVLSYFIYKREASA